MPVADFVVVAALPAEVPDPSVDQAGRALLQTEPQIYAQAGIPDVWRRKVYSVWKVYNEFRDKYKGIFCFRYSSF